MEEQSSIFQATIKKESGIDIQDSQEVNVDNKRLLNPDRTLFLPEGSVRAIITFLLIGICGYLIVMGIVVPEWFQALTAMSFGYYFGSKK